MSQYAFELSEPKEGWLDITIREENNVVKFPVSWLCDPIYILLSAFKSYLEKNYFFLVWDSTVFNGEEIDTFVTFHIGKIIVNIIDNEKRTIIQSHIFSMGLNDVMTEVMNQLTDEYMKKYYVEWYGYEDGIEEIEELEKLRKEVIDMIKREKYEI